MFDKLPLWLYFRRLYCPEVERATEGLLAPDPGGLIPLVGKWDFAVGAFSDCCCLVPALCGCAAVWWCWDAGFRGEAIWEMLSFLPLPFIVCSASALFCFVGSAGAGLNFLLSSFSTFELFAINEDPGDLDLVDVGILPELAGTFDIFDKFEAELKLAGDLGLLDGWGMPLLTSAGDFTLAATGTATPDAPWTGAAALLGDIFDLGWGIAEWGGGGWWVWSAGILRGNWLCTWEDMFTAVGVPQSGELVHDFVGVVFVLLIRFWLPFLEVTSNISETAAGGWDFEPNAFPKANLRDLAQTHKELRPS